MDKNEWIINVIDKIGFSCYDVVDVREITSIGDSYNVVTDQGDMWLEKDYCTIKKNAVGDIISIEYNTEYINVLIESLWRIDIDNVA